MAGKGGKGLLAAKTTAANKDKDKDKKRPISRSSRAGIQVTKICFFFFLSLLYISKLLYLFHILEDFRYSIFYSFFICSGI